MHLLRTALIGALLPVMAPAAVTPADSHSTDRSWTSAGDENGFHPLVADAADGYKWRTAATLSEPGVESDRWIGNVCVTGSRRRAVGGLRAAHVHQRGGALRSGWLHRRRRPDQRRRP